MINTLARSFLIKPGLNLNQVKTYCSGKVRLISAICQKRIYLEDADVRLDVSGLELGQVDADGVRASREGGAPLGGDAQVFLVSLVLELVVLLDSLEELVSAG